MADWLNAELKQLGVDTKLVDLGRHIMDGQDLPLPPAILGTLGTDPGKKTVLIYGHFDVQPVCLVYYYCSPLNAHSITGKQIRWLGFRTLHTHYRRGHRQADRTRQL